MAHGDNHAKETVLLQADRVEARLLENKSDPNAQGDAILLILQITKPLFMAKLVTAAELEAVKLTIPKSRLNWPSAAAVLGSVGMLVGLAMKLIP